MSAFVPSNKPSTDTVSRAAQLAVLVAALGYFVDIYDLILFSVVRKTSLLSLGVAEADLLEKGALLINMQMGGMLVGGLLWGALGDLRGRKSVLFGSILLYSFANVANGLVRTVPEYAALRFVAGVGLAGELGAGITLVSELLPKRARGWGTTIVAGVGILGAVAAALIGDKFPWRVAYFVGGGLGLALLLLRVGVSESGMFEGAKTAGVRRGNFFQLFTKPRRAMRYLAIVLVGVPIWYAIGILVTFAPEIGTGLGLATPPKASTAVLYAYVGLAIGDLGSGALSQLFRSRKRAVGLFLVLTSLGIAAYFAWGGSSLDALYLACLAVGVGGGYWAVFVTVAAEQFGTNIRATATTTAPNFVRGAVVLLTESFLALKGTYGAPGAAWRVGVVVMAVAFAALALLEETYGKDLDFVET